MAEIDIQKKEGQPAWVWIALIVGIIAVAGVLWAVMGNRDDADDVRMPRDTVPAARDTAVGWLERANDAMPDVVLLA